MYWWIPSVEKFSEAQCPAQECFGNHLFAHFPACVKPPVFYELAEDRGDVTCHNIHSTAIKIYHSSPSSSYSSVTCPPVEFLIWTSLHEHLWPDNVSNYNSVIILTAIKIPNVSNGNRVRGFFCSMYCVPDDMAALLPVLWFNLIKGVQWAVVCSVT